MKRAGFLFLLLVFVFVFCGACALYREMTPPDASVVQPPPAERTVFFQSIFPQQLNREPELPLPAPDMEATPDSLEESTPDRLAESLTNILVVGDSLSVGLGATMAEALRSRREVKVAQEGKVSSGLNSPRFYDWEEKLREFIRSKNPDLVVVMIGGNDAHNGSGSKKWAENFRNKVKNFLEIAVQSGLPVYWVGLPPMQKPDFSKKVKIANEVMESVCESYPNCEFIQTWPLCAGSDNEYTVVKDINGRQVTLRVGDGAHFTRVGYQVLSRHVLDQMEAGLSLGLN